jgi:DSBA-like thioredoxin domain-containing protein
VYQAAVLLQRVRESGERDIKLRWRYFSLSQVNNHEQGWTIWGAVAGDPAARGRLAFQAAEAARRQDRFAAFHVLMLEARHEHRRDLEDPAVVESVAGAAGLDLERLRADLADPAILDELARDHREAVSDLGVFGTPTFHFPGRGAAYVRVRPAPGGRAAIELLDQIASITAEEPYLLEIKRSRRDPGAAPAPVIHSGEAAPAATSFASRRPGS